MKCPCCGHEADFICLQKHHKFPQIAKYKKLYPEFIHDERNIQQACWNCNVSHGHPALVHWNEHQFCKAMGIMPRSKVGKEIWKRLPLSELWEIKR